MSDRRTKRVVITQSVGRAPVDQFLRAWCAGGVNSVGAP
jgi:hypothetical protein